MSTFVVQQPVASADASSVTTVISLLRGAAVAMTAGGWPVLVLHVTYIPAQEICLSLVDTEDAATVIETLRRAGSHAAQVLPALSL